MSKIIFTYHFPYITPLWIHYRNNYYYGIYQQGFRIGNVNNGYSYCHLFETFRVYL